MKLELEGYEVELLRLALNEAMDATDNTARYKLYEQLLNKINGEDEND